MYKKEYINFKQTLSVKGGIQICGSGLTILFCTNLLERNNKMSFRNITIVEIFIFIGLVFVAASPLISCITNDSEAMKALEDNGFSNVQITDRGSLGAGFAGCGDKDQAYYEATATNPAGRRVNMLVCCGGGLSFKGCTIRSK